MTYDCMTPEELTLWQMPYRPSDVAPVIPCTDCPMWFHLQEKAAGRCSLSPRTGGRPPIYANALARKHARSVREARHAASSGAQ
jgi:hypothetical protein